MGKAAQCPKVLMSCAHLGVRGMRPRRASAGLRSLFHSASKAQEQGEAQDRSCNRATWGRRGNCAATVGQPAPPGVAGWRARWWRREWSRGPEGTEG